MVISRDVTGSGGGETVIIGAPFLLNLPFPRGERGPAGPVLNAFTPLSFPPKLREGLAFASCLRNLSPASVVSVVCLFVSWLAGPFILELQIKFAGCGRKERKTRTLAGDVSCEPYARRGGRREVVGEEVRNTEDSLGAAAFLTNLAGKICSQAVSSSCGRFGLA